MTTIGAFEKITFYYKLTDGFNEYLLGSGVISNTIGNVILKLGMENHF